MKVNCFFHAENGENEFLFQIQLNAGIVNYYSTKAIHVLLAVS